MCKYNMYRIEYGLYMRLRFFFLSKKGEDPIVLTFQVYKYV